MSKYEQLDISPEEARLRAFCEHILEQRVIACGTDNGDFFLTFEDGAEIVFWAEDDLLQMNMYNNDRSKFN